ncbi:MAG: hypothetical protein HY246_23250 [Proteobacteria bacterium]|nr:hypothetical protein [Pseudomonadota bacterium]
MGSGQNFSGWPPAGAEAKEIACFKGPFYGATRRSREQEQAWVPTYVGTTA